MEQVRTSMISNPDIWQLKAAVFCRNQSLELIESPIGPIDSTQVLVEVSDVGLCRTDLYAIDGKIPVYDPFFVPGHEFSGKVVAIGSAVSPKWIGRMVAVNPVVPCWHCEDCENQTSHLCCDTKMMGIDVEGACRQVVSVDVRQVYAVGNLDPKEAVFAEPVAATLGIVNANIETDQQGLILGQGRIAELARRVLSAKGFANLSVLNAIEAKRIAASSFDFVVETGVDTSLFCEMVRLAKPRGVLVLKSRQVTPFEVTIRDLVNKQPVIDVVNYGCFEEAVRLLVSREVEVNDLIGPTFAFREVEEAVARANNDEASKIFLNGWG